MHTTLRNAARRGFTLIELLVVIAIIGILSAVVMAALNTAREKGNDTAVKANFDSIATQAAIYYDNNASTYAAADINNSCTGDLFSDPTISAAIGSADRANGTGTLTCYASATAYAVQSTRALTDPPSTYWCVDSSGAKCGTNQSISGTSCPACAATN